MLHRAVDIQLVEPGVQLLVQFVAQLAQPLAFGRHLEPADLRGLAEPDDAGDVQRARPHAALVAATVDLLGQQHARIPPAHVEGAHTLRTVHLVRRDRGQVGLRLGHVERHLADGLDGVGMQQDALLLRDRPDLGRRLQHADLVVGRHDRDQDRLVGDRGAQILDVDPPVLLHREIGDAVALLLELLAGVDHRLVLDHTGDDVIALLAIHLGDALDRQVVGLGRAAREDDLLRIGADEVRDLLARGLDGLLSLPAEGVVAARRIAEVVGEVRQHRLDDPWIDGRRGVIVHVNRELHLCLYLSGLPERRTGIPYLPERPPALPIYRNASPAFLERMTATGAGATVSAAISESVTVPSAATMRSRICQSGSRMLHLLYCSQVFFSDVHAVTVSGPSIAWMTSATLINLGTRLRA